MSEDARNVFFVVLDTVRKDRLSVYGHDRPTTPGLEDFAEEATVFEEAVAQAPWTLPVHASMFTGLYPGQHGATQESPYLEGGRTLAEALGDAGYDTACYSSNAWITPYTGLTRGFHDTDNFFEVMPGDLLSGPLARAWKAMNDRPRLRSVADRLVELGNVVHERTTRDSGGDSKSPAAVDRALSFVDGTEGPHFAFLNLMDAHLPYYPPEAYREQFAPDADPDAVCQNSKEYNCGARAIDAAEWRDIRGLYDAEIAHADAQVARLFDALRERGLWDDSLVIVCADHGELHGEHDLYGHEFCLYDPLVNVPLLVKHPDLDGGRREDQVELLDLYHTVLDATGVGGDGDTAGDSPAESGVPVAGDGGAAGVAFDPTRSLLHEAYRSFDGGVNAYVEYSLPVVELNQLETKASNAGIALAEDSRFYSRMRAIRRPDAKYVANERIPDECYDLATDPGEQHPIDVDEGNGAQSPCSDLADELAAFADRVGADWGDVGDGETALAEMDEAAVDRLRELGYVE